MTDLMRYAASLEGAGGKSLPPVEKWHPEFCGEIDLVIKRDGTWFHEGTPIGRARLVRLFSTVLRREGDKHFLVTPVEKLEITVEDAPFVAVLMKREGEGADTSTGQKLSFTTNVGDEATAGPAHLLTFRKDDETGECAPYINVRAGLEARIARAVYYDLVELGETREIGGEEQFGVWSDGVFFPFGLASEVYA
ncbi:DUF1285 domain-containing protein [Hyphococcus sp.]|uniref:DUF1285 domain-containing protein n=1 Tax=Hyphococcus sp. TaxID=2038636 RepID=UPI00207E1FB6|nr:MAG: hypothetical protein DHS20C04_02190 [Marinicaulis sp.]